MAQNVFGAVPVCPRMPPPAHPALKGTQAIKMHNFLPVIPQRRRVRTTKIVLSRLLNKNILSLVASKKSIKDTFSE